MKLEHYLDRDKLAQRIQEGYVDVKTHPTLPLQLYCHTRMAVLDNFWDEITTKCRGLIVNKFNGEIVARPFEKFFNVNTEDRPETHVSGFLAYTLPRPIVSDKLDGSLGIFWEYEGHWGVASKGSFTSVHAQWMTQRLAQHIEEHGSLIWPEGYTPVFEMIAESVQTHVIDYHGEERLVLIALINKSSGEELLPVALESYGKRNHLPTPTFYNMNLAGAFALDRENHEGFVFTYPRLGQPPLKVKVKHPTFLRVQKVVHHVSPKNLLEMLMHNDMAGLEDWQKQLPTHVSQQVREWSRLYWEAYRTNQAEAIMRTHVILTTTTTRKEAAEFLRRQENAPYAAICFAYLDQNVEGYRKSLWKLVGKQVQINNTVDGGE